MNLISLAKAATEMSAVAANAFHGYRDRNMSKLDSTATGVGVAFFIVFWTATDNVGLGIAMGLSLGAAIATSRQQEKQQDADPNDSET